MTVTQQQFEQVLAQRAEAMRYLACLIDLMGGEVRLGPTDLLPDRVLQKEEIGITGVIRLTVEKPR